VHISGSRVVVKRPEGTLQQVKQKAIVKQTVQKAVKKEEKKPGPIDFRKIKQQVQAELTGKPIPKGSKKSTPIAQPKPKEAPKETAPGELDLSSIKAEIESELKGNKKPKQETTTTSKDRIQTGIPGLDDAMGGGFRKKNGNLGRRWTRNWQNNICNAVFDEWYQPI